MVVHNMLNIVLPSRNTLRSDLARLAGRKVNCKNLDGIKINVCGVQYRIAKESAANEIEFLQQIVR